MAWIWIVRVYTLMIRRLLPCTINTLKAVGLMCCFANFYFYLFIFTFYWNHRHRKGERERQRLLFLPWNPTTARLEQAGARILQVTPGPSHELQRPKCLTHHLPQAKTLVCWETQEQNSNQTFQVVPFTKQAAPKWDCDCGTKNSAVMISWMLQRTYFKHIKVKLNFWESEQNDPMLIKSLIHWEI